MSDKEEAPAAPLERSGSLMQKTIELCRPHKAKDLEQLTGVPWHWLHQFKRGKINDPSVNRVQHIYETLTGTKLFEAWGASHDLG